MGQNRQAPAGLVAYCPRVISQLSMVVCCSFQASLCWVEPTVRREVFVQTGPCQRHSASQGPSPACAGPRAEAASHCLGSP